MQYLNRFFLLGMALFAVIGLSACTGANRPQQGMDDTMSPQETNTSGTGTADNAEIPSGTSSTGTQSSPSTNTGGIDTTGTQSGSTETGTGSSGMGVGSPSPSGTAGPPAGGRGNASSGGQ